MKKSDKMLLATLSQCIADRDKAALNIDKILESDSLDSVKLLQKEFSKLSKAEILIESIQIYYAKNFGTEPIKEEEK